MPNIYSLTLATHTHTYTHTHTHTQTHTHTPHTHTHTHTHTPHTHTHTTHTHTHTHTHTTHTNTHTHKHTNTHTHTHRYGEEKAELSVVINVPGWVSTDPRPYGPLGGIDSRYVAADFMVPVMSADRVGEAYTLVWESRKLCVGWHHPPCHAATSLRRLAGPFFVELTLE
jgi:hypothetical protein